MSTPKNIMMLITNLGKGGAQRVFYDHAMEFSKRYQVAEAVFNLYNDDRLYNTQLPIYSLDEKNTKRNPLKNLFTRAKKVSKLARNLQTDIVISHMDGANWVNALSAGKAKKILVVHGTVLHDHDIHPKFNKLRQKVIIPYLYNKADITVAVSEGIAEELRTRCGVKNVLAIPNFFDIEAIRQKAGLPLCAAWQEIYNSAPILVNSGRFHHQKKQTELLQIFAALKKHGNHAKLILLGDGALRDKLINDCGQLGLTQYNVWDAAKTLHTGYDVYFTGYLENPFSFLNKSTLFVFPSGWEGFPMALCEAMISGVTVLSADCPTGPREILAPGTKDINYTLNSAEKTKYGVLLPMVNKKDYVPVWVAAIEELLKNENHRKALAQNALVRMQDFDRKKVMARWLQLINDIIK